MEISQPTRSVAIGSYALAVGAPAGSRIFHGSEIADDAATEVADALRKETAGQAFERAVVDAQEAARRVEQAEALLQDVLAGRPWDPADLSERAGEMLKVFARLDKDERYEEWFRYARAVNGLLALAMRWAKLVGSLRDTLRAAEGAMKLEPAVAWAEHELGTLHLAVEDAAGAERRLERHARSEIGWATPTASPRPSRASPSCADSGRSCAGWTAAAGSTAGCC
jgi:hypothetical protein